MRAIVTVKFAPSVVGEVYNPKEIQSVIQGYQTLQAKGVLGQPDLVTLRFLVDGHSGVEEIEAPVNDQPTQEG